MYIFNNKEIPCITDALENAMILVFRSIIRRNMQKALNLLQQRIFNALSQNIKNIRDTYTFRTLKCLLLENCFYFFNHLCVYVQSRPFIIMISTCYIFSR